MRRIFLFLAIPLIAHADPATERLWKAKCGSCHGADGKAQTEQGKKMSISDMSSAAWQGEFTDDKIKAAISDGVKRDKNGVKQEMDSYKSKLRADQIDAVAAYIRTLKK
jgi:mono/diheme cytochrome c family protein